MRNRNSNQKQMETPAKWNKRWERRSNNNVLDLGWGADNKWIVHFFLQMINNRKFVIKFHRMNIL